MTRIWTKKEMEDGVEGLTRIFRIFFYINSMCRHKRVKTYTDKQCTHKKKIKKINDHAWWANQCDKNTVKIKTKSILETCSREFLVRVYRFIFMHQLCKTQKERT